MVHTCVYTHAYTHAYAHVNAHVHTQPLARTQTAESGGTDVHTSGGSSRPCTGGILHGPETPDGKRRRSERSVRWGGGKIEQVTPDVVMACIVMASIPARSVRCGGGTIEQVYSYGRYGYCLYRYGLHPRALGALGAVARSSRSSSRI